MKPNTRWQRKRRIVWLSPTALVFFAALIVPGRPAPAEANTAGGTGKAGQVVELKLKEGQIFRLPDTEVVIQVKQVRDFTSNGCLGGPVGCPDQTRLKITCAKVAQEFVLYVAHTLAQQGRGINRTNFFGYEFRLTALKLRQITLAVRKTEGSSTRGTEEGGFRR